MLLTDITLTCFSRKSHSLGEASHSQMNVNSLRLMIATLFSCAAHAQDAPNGPSDGWSGWFLNNVTFQKSTEDALRNRPISYRPDLVTDTGGRLLNIFGLEFKSGDWTCMGHCQFDVGQGDGTCHEPPTAMGQRLLVMPRVQIP